MEESFKILIKNYDRINKKYFLGKQEIDTFKFQDLVVLLKELSNNSEKFAVPIQIITHDLIIEKKDKNLFTYEYNRLFPYNIRLSKKEFELNELNNIFDSKKPKRVEYLKSSLYFSFLFVLWFYFVSFNIQSIVIFIGQNFGTMTINIFFSWLFFVSTGGFLYFIYDFISKPIMYNYKIPLKYSKPSNYILKKNELYHFFLFTGQLFYFFILYYLYFAHANLILIEDLFNLFKVMLIPGSIIAIHYLVISVKLLVSNFKIKKKLLVFSYALLQNLNVQKEEQELNLKIVNDIENSKSISFGLISGIIGFLTLILAIIPNILFNP